MDNNLPEVININFIIAYSTSFFYYYEANSNGVEILRLILFIVMHYFKWFNKSKHDVISVEFYLTFWCQDGWDYYRNQNYSFN